MKYNRLKVPLIIFECDYCNKSSAQSLCQYGKYKHHYCCKKCQDTHKQVDKTVSPNYGRIRTDAWAKAIGDRARGKKASFETRRKQSLAHIGLLKGEKNPNWNGGSTAEMYPAGWGNLIKGQVRERDNFTCQMCSKKQSEYSRLLDVHHIDYNKNNCSIDNLVALCRTCHIKTSHNRLKWIEYFNKRKEEVLCCTLELTTEKKAVSQS